MGEVYEGKIRSVSEHRQSDKKRLLLIRLNNSANFEVDTMSQSVIFVSDLVERETYGFVALDSVEVVSEISRQITPSMHAYCIRDTCGCQ
jgi:hypothetical protein